MVPNLMIGFGIDEIQAEYVAEIRLRQLNREYILKRTDEIGELEKDIAEMEAMASRAPEDPFGNHHRSCAGHGQKYGQPRQRISHLRRAMNARRPRRTVPRLPGEPVLHPGGLLQEDHHPVAADERRSEAQGGGRASPSRWTATNRSELLFFTDKSQVYKTTAADFADTKASVLGDYLPAKLGRWTSGENAAYMAVTTDYEGYLLFAFENGKVAKVALSAYATKTRTAASWQTLTATRHGWSRCCSLPRTARCSSPPAIPGCSLSTPA